MCYKLRLGHSERYLQAANALLEATGTETASPGPQESSSFQDHGSILFDSLVIHDDEAATRLWGGAEVGKKGRRRGHKVGGFFPATVLAGSDSVTGGSAHACPHEQSLPDGVPAQSQQSQAKGALQIRPQAGVSISCNITRYYSSCRDLLCDTVQVQYVGAV